MAAVQTLHTMTLGNQQNNGKLLYMVHHNNAAQANCVSVSTGLTQNKGMVLQTKRPLAPAPQKGSVLVNGNSPDVLRCKRKINFVPYGGAAHQPASVARRNARERNRVKQVNNGFATLRQHIPASVAAALSSPGATTNTRSANKKLSKVETLRLAVEYIRSLQRMIEDYEAKVPTDNGAKLTSYYTSTTPVDITQLQPLQQTPPCSEASASPTPSFSSESSTSVSSSYVQTALYSTENYENYEPTSPEDEELLDAISWWQQQ